MKKSFIILASSLLLAGGLTSCDKQYTCVCTYKELGVEKTNESQTVKTSKDEAKAICERATYIDGAKATCVIKE